MNSITEAWLESASGDLQNIAYIIKDENLTHIVAFHAYIKKKVEDNPL